MRSITLSLVIVFIGCREPKREASLPAGRAEVAPVVTIEGEFARSLQLDYRSPMLPRSKSMETSLHAAACRRGEPSACLRATSAFAAQDLFPTIEANCRAGHDLSCRSAAANKGEFGNEYPFALSSAELRRGCAAGLWAECDLLFESESPSDARFSAETTCVQVRRRCSSAGDKYLHVEPRNQDRGRYLLELGCQSADFSSCLQLAYAYVEGEVPEPVPGRGRDLVRYVCERAPNENCMAGKLPWSLPN